MKIRGNDPFFNMFEEFFTPPVNYGRSLRNETNNTNRNISENLPSTNIVETKGDYQYELLTPGFDKENIKIELDDNTLTVRGERLVENNTERDYLTKEFYSQKFSRTFTTPEGVVLDEIYAKVENGITTLFLPKEKLGKTKKVNRNIEII
jgi:HSP20 family protein